MQKHSRICYKSILRLLGRLLIIEGTFISVTGIYSFIVKDGAHISIFLSALIAYSIGVIMNFASKKSNYQIGRREGYISVSSSWIVISLFGAMPFYFSGEIPDFTNAFFETISGFTTTGASILNNIEHIPESLLLWRSLTQWLGGMGIIVLTLAILPTLGVGGMQLFVAEVPGPSVDKLHPKIAETAKRLWGIYLLLTLIEAILLYFGGMTMFDAINHAFTTMATGGYSTKQSSIAFYDSAFIQYVIIVFMFLAGTNFTLNYFMLKGAFKNVWKNEEFRYYFGFAIIFTLIIAVGLSFLNDDSIEKAFRDSLFQVVSIITTTGYATVDYLKWTPFLLMLIFVLMFFGGSSGSTGGGIKIARIVIALKNSYLELKRLVIPNVVIPLKLNKRAITTDISHNILAFIVIYMIIFISGVLIMSALGLNLESAMGAVAACLGNIGPGIGSVGPAENFAHIPVIGKWVLSFFMLLGRLELFTILAILAPAFWKK